MLPKIHKFLSPKINKNLTDSSLIFPAFPIPFHMICFQIRHASISLSLFPAISSNSRVCDLEPKEFLLIEGAVFPFGTVVAFWLSKVEPFKLTSRSPARERLGKFGSFSFSGWVCLIPKIETEGVFQTKNHTKSPKPIWRVATHQQLNLLCYFYSPSIYNKHT